MRFGAKTLFGTNIQTHDGFEFDSGMRGSLTGNEHYPVRFVGKAKPTLPRYMPIYDKDGNFEGSLTLGHSIPQYDMSQEKLGPAAQVGDRDREAESSASFSGTPDFQPGQSRPAFFEAARKLLNRLESDDDWKNRKGFDMDDVKKAQMNACRILVSIECEIRRRDFRPFDVISRFQGWTNLDARSRGIELDIEDATKAISRAEYKFLHPNPPIHKALMKFSILAVSLLQLVVSLFVVVRFMDDDWYDTGAAVSAICLSVLPILVISAVVSRELKQDGWIHLRLERARLEEKRRIQEIRDFESRSTEKAHRPKGG